MIDASAVRTVSNGRIVAIGLLGVILLVGLSAGAIATADSSSMAESQHQESLAGGTDLTSYAVHPPASLPGDTLAHIGSESTETSEISNATRSIEQSTLEPGEETVVTVDVEATAPADLVVYETFDQQFEAVEIIDTDPVGIAAAVTDDNEELLALWEERDAATIQYRVTVPDDAETNATLSIDGYAETETDEVNISGADEITVEESDDGGVALPPPPESDPEPATFVVDIGSEVDAATVGEEFEITVDVENVGETDATKTVTLELDGEPIGEQSVTLEGGADQSVVFTVTAPATAGTADVVAYTPDDEASATVTVEAPDDDPAEVDDDGDDTADEPADDVEDEADDSMPGFAIALTVVALTCAVFVLRRPN